jgi:hypothetical protein
VLVCPACPEPKLDLRGEYLFWWLRQARIPPAVTTGPMETQGIVDAADVDVLYGDRKLESRHVRYVGTRWTLRYGADAVDTISLEASGLFLERDSTYFKTRSTGDVLLAIPYHDALTDEESSEVFAGIDPNRGLLSGAYCGYTKIEFFSEQGNLILPLLRTDAFLAEAVLGVHCLQMRERLDLTAASKLLPEEAVIFSVEDHFRAHNAFYGGQLGVRCEYATGPWFLRAASTLALGANQQVVRAYGNRVFHTPLERTVADFGLFVQESNAGRFERWRLDVASEVGLNLGLRLSDAIDLLCGYSMLWWHNPVRPGDQVDRTVNSSAIRTGTFTGPARPATSWKEDFFWAQGLNVGAEVRW